MNKVSTIGLDLAKEVFQVHGADAAGAVVFRSDCAGVAWCNSLQPKRRVELRWKPALLRTIGAVSFPGSVMKFGSFPHPM